VDMWWNNDLVELVEVLCEADVAQAGSWFFWWSVGIVCNMCDAGMLRTGPRGSDRSTAVVVCRSLSVFRGLTVLPCVTEREEVATYVWE
jgi:hypothetical protein